MEAAASTDTHALLVQAIQDKRQLRFVHHGKPRVVEPQCHGIGTRGTKLLRARQLGDGVPHKPLFDVDKISELRMLGDVFLHPGPHYKRDGSAMRLIFSQL